MKLFVDTANIDEIKKANDWGILDGVTTNPSLIAKEGVKHKDRVLQICDLLGPNKAVSAECVKTDFNDVMAEARDIASWHPDIYVKVAMTPTNVEVMAKLTQEGVKFNCTLVFSLDQALIAAKAGASFISFFVGRIDDMGSAEAMPAIGDAVEMVETYDFPQKPEILVASIRSVYHITESIRLGAHIATIPYKVMEQMFHHPLTDLGIARFDADYRKSIEDAGSMTEDSANKGK